MASTLTEAQLRELREMLEARMQALRAEVREALLRSDDETFIDLAGRVHDLEEQSVADLLVDTGLAEIDRRLGGLREVEHALGRVSQGTYGRCVACGEPIAYERLRAQPAASRCHDCQTRYEQTHRQPGHSSL